MSHCWDDRDQRGMNQAILVERLPGRANGTIPRQEDKTFQKAAFRSIGDNFMRRLAVCPLNALGLCSPAPTRNCQQEKQRCSVKETQVVNGVAAGSTNMDEVDVESIE